MPSSSCSVEPLEPSKAEFREIESWLDRGLRRGEDGRLRAEYPLSFHRGVTANQRVIRLEGELAAHALLHEAELRAGERALRVGMIGLVYTDPAARGQGLATRCVESCIQEMERRGIALALLWSDKHAFYARMGFQPAGSEWILEWPSDRVPGRDRRPRAALPVTAPEPSDWAALERLHARKPIRALRPEGSLAHLTAGPETHVVVARDGAGEPLAYAVAGRGDDFGACVHEWAGSPEGVLACIDALHEQGRAQLVLAGPAGDPTREALLERCPKRQAGIFALARILDAKALWAGVAPREPLPASDAGLLERLFGPAGRPGSTGGRSEPTLYLWGLDSI